MLKRSALLLPIACLLSFVTCSHAQGLAGSSPRDERGDSALLSLEEFREVALLLQQREDADGEITVQRRALARLITAHGLSITRGNTFEREAFSLREALTQCTGETAAVRREGLAEVRLWKGRFFVAVGVGVAITGTALYIATLNP